MYVFIPFLVYFMGQREAQAHHSGADNSSLLRGMLSARDKAQGARLENVLAELTNW